MLDQDQTGIVFNIQKFSVHDGKGIRTLVFLKGCPLTCKWCSNPESQKMRIEKAFNNMRCLGAELCGRCSRTCSAGAISINNGMLCIDSSKCQSCFSCSVACPSGAQTIYGEEMSVDSVLRKVEEDGVFYARGGGGLTLSGGEVMMQPVFVNALLREAKVRHINTIIETCGHYSYNILAKVCENLNAIIYDIKSLSSAKHKEFTGVGNELILSNFKRLCVDFPKLKILARTPVVPGFNDTEEDIIAIRDFLPKAENVSYELLGYHRMGEPKYEYLGRKYEMHGVVLDSEHLAHLESLLK